MTDNDDTPDLSRRHLLTRLGLAAGAAYAAPTLLQLTPAHASGFSRSSGYSRPSFSRPSHSRPSFSRPSFSRPSHGAYRGRPRYYEQGGYNGPYRDHLTREERAARYLLETLTTR